MNGFSFYICFGKWVTPGLTVNKYCIRFVLGFVSIGFMIRDIEVSIIDRAVRLLKENHMLRSINGRRIRENDEINRR
jgi:hypothetical protein